MNKSVQAFLAKADRALRAAETLLGTGDADFAIARAYYALFYIAEALLLSKDLRFRKRNSVHAAFGEHFAKSGLLDPKFHRWLLDAFDQRILSDYGVEAELTSEDARRVLAHAREFLAEARRLLDMCA